MLSSRLRELAHVSHLSALAVVAWPLAVTLLLHLPALEARCDRAASATFARISLFQLHYGLCHDAVYPSY